MGSLQERLPEFQQLNNVPENPLISYLAVRVDRWNGAELARVLRMARTGVSESVEHGNLLVRKNPTMMKIIKS
jgi:hypothetical protein